MKEIGDKSKLCFVVGCKNEGGLQEVDIWASNTLLTPVDNMAYLPQFIATLEGERRDIEAGAICENYSYFNHGPTTDDVVGKARVVGNLAKLNFEMDSIDCSVSIPIAELLSVYKNTIECLRAINA